MNYWCNISREVYQNLRIWVFFTVLITIFRIIFIGIFHGQLGSVPISDMLMSLWLGFRLSLKTVGWIVLIHMVLVSIPRVVLAERFTKFFNTWRTVLLSIITLVLTLLFVGRIPFYRIFNATYNMMLVNGKHDDIGAIIKTGIEQYHAIPFLIGAILVSIGLSALLRKWLQKPTKQYVPTTKRRQWITGVLGTAIFAVLFILSRYGGVFNYNHSITWESAARLQSNLLNEAVLDDGQALYRVYTIARRIHNLAKTNISETELRALIERNGGNPNAADFDHAFTKTIDTERLKEQPNTVYLIVGESYGLWPFLSEFDGVGDYVAHEGRKLTNMPNSMHTHYALAQGTGTMPAINGSLTGMPDTGLYPNYEGTSYDAAYGLGIGPTMKQMGYKTIFWYGGYGTWQNVKDFALAQGFDEFRDASEIESNVRNAWGVPDENLFNAIESYMAQHKGEKIFNLVLTTSNHPPYSIDLKAAGYDPTQIDTNLPNSINNTPETLNELGHFWYTDMLMGRFVNHIEQNVDSSALFIVTGDHSERFNFAIEEPENVTATVPIIIHGQGVQHEWLADDVYGMSIQIVPTLAELVGRTGQTYESMVPSLFEQMPFVFNHRLYMDQQGIKLQNKQMPNDYKRTIEDMRKLAVWRIKKGNRL